VTPFHDLQDYFFFFLALPRLYGLRLFPGRQLAAS